MSKKEITKKEIIEKVKSNDYNFFYNIYNNSYNSKKGDPIEIVHERNLGDGNEYFITLKFRDVGYIVQLEGWYSSWDSPQWDKVSFAKPFTFTETRYKAISKSEIRDSKIDEVLD